MHERVKVLFVTWGHSIHAQRRIQLFVEDPRFDVTVVSSFHYGFRGARNVALSAAQPQQDASTPGTNNQPHLAANTFLPKRLSQHIAWLSHLGTMLNETASSLRDLRILQNTLDDVQPQVLFLQTLFYPCYLALFTKSDAKRIITFWNGDLLAWTRHTGLERLFKKRLVRAAIRRADAITVNSAAAADACIEQGASPQNVHLIRYPGLDLEQFKPLDKPAAKASLGLADKRLVLSERGPLPHQNLDVIVQAAPTILAQFPNTIFMFLSAARGVGPDAFIKFHDLAVSLGVDQAMIWKGNVPHADLPTILSAADVSVSLSLEDSLPNAMLDAMACGTPVVMGDLPQIREWVTEGENGFVVPQRDATRVAQAVCAILSNPELAAGMIRKNLRMVAERADSAAQVPLIKDLVLRVAAPELDAARFH